MNKPVSILTSATPSSTQLSILLVDDEDAFCRQACLFLKSEGYFVTMENDANSVMSRYHELNPQIIVLDVDLGEKNLDGRMLCSSIVKTERYQQGEVGIVLISGHYINPGDELIGFTVGADNYLTKPFELSQLAVRIGALARRLKLTTVSNRIELGELSIDRDSRIVMIGSNLIELSKLEFDVLAYLAESPGLVRTKSDLLEHAWSTPYVEDSAVAKCISLLRKKLSADNPDSYIRTVYGVGYCFSSNS